MFIEEVGVEAGPLGGIEHEATDEVVEGNDGEGLGDENGFGLGEELEASSGVRFGQGGSEEGVVGGVGPAGAIIAPAGDEAVEKGVGIVVIPDPAGAGDIEIEFIERFEVGGPLLVAKFDFNPEDTFPLGLDFDGDLFVQLRFVVEERDAGKAFPLGEAGQFQEALGGGGVGGKTFGGAVIGDSGGSEGLGDWLMAAGDFFDDGFFIEGESEGAANANILEGGASDIEAVEVGGEKRAGVEIGTAAQVGQHEGGDEAFIEEEIGLAGGVEIEGGTGPGDGEGVDAFELGIVGVVMEGIFFEGDAVIDFPIEEAVGAVADPSFGMGPAVPIFFDGGLVNGQVGGEGGEGGKVGGGVVQGDAESEIVGSREADRVAGGGALMKNFGLGNTEENFGVGGGGFGVESTEPAVAVVAGGEGLAIGPAEVGAKVEGVGFSVGRDVP